MYNLSVQKSKIVKDLMLKWKWRVMYLPVYTPAYAPIENWFSLIKSYLKRRYITESIKTNLHQNYSTVYYALKSLSSKTIRRLFANLFANLFARIKQNISKLEQ